MEKNTPLTNLAMRIIDATDKAILWNDKAAKENSKIKLDHIDNYHSFLKTKLLAKKIKTSLERSPCIGVFGPSQAGKSYLVSTLAKGIKGSLTVNLADQHIDFLQRINPSGGRESTGVVTRFSKKVSNYSNKNFPVEIRLLTEVDLLKILINSFFSDFDHAGSVDLEVFSDEQITSRLDKLRTRNLSKEPSTILPEEILDLKIYLEAIFGNFVSNLKAEFWPVALSIAPYLSIKDKAELFAIIWRDFQLFSDLYILLAEQIEFLKGADSCLAPLESILSDGGEISLVDAQQLSKLNKANELLEVIPIIGSTSQPMTKISKSVLAALTAELRLTISDAKWPFLDDLDVLDFPGARSRKSLNSKDIREIESNSEIRNNQASDLLLRGKVAYLFQRYTADQEMTAVLLCVPGGPQEVGYAPLINQWVIDSIGETPDKRAKMPPSLLFVLTKFDEELKSKGGDNEINERARWANRIESSLLEKFKNYEWIKKWDEHPFKNLFWLRNPEIKSSTFMKYENGSEISLNPDDEERLQRLKVFFTEDKNVQEHFTNPAEAWDAAMLPKDGGISRIVSGINLVCNPNFREKNLEEKINNLKENFISKVKPFYNESGEIEIAKKTEILNQIKKEIIHLVQKNDLWMIFDKLNLSLEELKTLYFMVNSGLQTENLGKFTSNKFNTTKDSEVDLDSLLNSSIESWANESNEEIIKDSLDVHPRASAYAKKILDRWSTKLRDLVDDSFTAKSLFFTEKTFGLLIEELINASQRLNFFEKLATKLDAAENNAGATWEKIVDRQMIIAFNTLSDFINQFGMGELPLSQRPKMSFSNSYRNVFEPFNKNNNSDTFLSEKPIPVTSLIARDWIFGLERIVIDNAGFLSKDSLSPELNKELGLIIEELSN